MERRSIQGPGRWGQSVIRRAMRLLAASLALALAGPVALAAQGDGPRHIRPRPMRFERLSLEDGLSQSIVNCILQDQAGFLWLGTQDGLNRYDGYGFEVYRHDPENPASLPNDFIMTLAEDPAGDLWIGTEGGGLARWRRTTDSFETFRHDPGDPATLSGDRVVDLIWDLAGALWIGTLDSGVTRLDTAAGSFRRFRHEPDAGSLSHDRVGAMYVDRRGDFWVGTRGGLDRFDRLTESFVHYRHDPADPTSLSDDRVHAIVEDRRGYLWVGTEAGLNRLDPRTGVFERHLHRGGEAASLSHSWVRALLEDRDGRLWIGTDGGLNLWQGEGGRFTSYHPDPADPSSLGSDLVVDLYQDRGGILWVGTLGAGASKWNPATWSFPHYRTGEEEGAGNMVLAISEDAGGGVWIGTFGGGLERIDRRAGPSALTRFVHDSRNPGSLSDDRVTALAHDREGKLWVGTIGGGLNRFDGSQSFERHRHDPAAPESLAADAVTSLFEDGEGRLWIGTHGGGLDLHLGNGAFRHFRHDPADDASLSADRIFGMAEDGDGRLWLATDGGGLNRLDPESGVFLRLEHDPADLDGLSSNDLNTLHVDGSGRLWIGTEGRGLDRLEWLDEETGRAVFRNWSRADGLPDDTIWGLRSDDAGDLWLATNQGLARLDPRTGEVTSYDVTDGLQSNEFMHGAHFKSPSGELFFGGVNGFNAFYPDRIRRNRHVPPVVLTSFTIIDRPVSFDRPLAAVSDVRLGWRDYRFSLELAALDFAAPEKNRYRYRIDGFDPDWVDLGHERRVTLTNLDPGRYVLHLQGSNNDGVWNEEGTSLVIRVEPPPWETWWAWALYVLASGSAALGLVRLHHNKVERERAIARRERAQAAERERLIAELEQKNDELERFNYTASHDLKTPLVTIKGFLGLLEKDVVTGDAERLKEDVHHIGNAADKMGELLDELLEYTRIGRHANPPELVSLSELANEAATLVRGLVEERAVSVEISPDLPAVIGDRLRLRAVFQNLLGNAVKYIGDQDSPRVEVGMRRGTDEDPAAPVVYVCDNGIGIDPAYHDTVFGLFERLDATDQGTGLGLALVKRIVETHGGRIWVESEGLGHGSTFCFVLGRGGGAEPTENGSGEPASEPLAVT